MLSSPVDIGYGIGKIGASLCGWLTVFVWNYLRHSCGNRGLGTKLTRKQTRELEPERERASLLWFSDVYLRYRRTGSLTIANFFLFFVVLVTPPPFLPGSFLHVGVAWVARSELKFITRDRIGN